MRKITLLLGILFFAQGPEALYATNLADRTAGQHLQVPIVLVGYQTVLTSGGYEVTIYVEYNPNMGVIVDVYGEDDMGNPITVNSYNGTISHVGGTLYANNFNVNVSGSFGTSWVFLSGALTPWP